MFTGCFSIAGQNDRTQTFLAQFLKDLSCLWPDVVTQDKPPNQISTSKPNFGQTRLGSRRAVQNRGGQSLREPLSSAQQANSSILSSTQALSGHRFESLEFHAD